MSFLEDPRVRVFIVVTITTVIALGIGMLMSRLLSPPPKKCKGDTHLDKNTNKCVPNCQDGYKNDPITGECVIDCPDGEVSSKSISGVTIPGKERCVVPCGSAYCDPETELTLCQDGVCYIPNCKTTDNESSYCAPPLLCGTDSKGKKKTKLPKGATLNSHGCYTHNSPNPPPKPVCSDPTPNLKTGSGAYSKEHVCCKTSEFGVYTKEGEPFCCPDKDDVIIGRKCCPKSKQCPKDNPTDCLESDQVCTDEGKCSKTYAIGQPGNYTGCCPFPTSNGECYNMCTYTGSDETGMKDTCTVDSDCDFKDKFSFDSEKIPAAGGKCDNGKCRLYCGAADADTHSDVSCLNDPNNKKSTCINTSNMCNFSQNKYNPPQSNNAYICKDTTTKSPSSYWKSSSGAPTLTVSAIMETPEDCTELSCLDRMITTGLLGATGEITKSGKQRTLPVVSGSSTPNIKDKMCVAEIECNKMKILQGGNLVDWSKQTVNPNNIAIKMNTVKSGIFNGSYSGDPKYSDCNVAATPSSCVFFPNGVFSKYGTYDGVNLSDRVLSGTGCAPASWGNPNNKYPNNILCSVTKTNNQSGGYDIKPNYYCPKWSDCCGEGGLISSSDYKTCICLSNATQSGKLPNIKCNYNTSTNGIISSNNPVKAAGWPPHSSIKNAKYLSLENTMTPKWVKTNVGNKSHMNIKYSRALVIMSLNGKYIGFNIHSHELGTVSPDNHINFYYTWCDGQNLEPYGQIPLNKGYFRFGSGQHFGTPNNHLGRPVRVTDKGNKPAKRDTSWGTSGDATTMFDTGKMLTIVKVEDKWYLASVKCFYWKSGPTYGIQQGEGKIHYGVYNSSKNRFEFTALRETNATPIEINYVLSETPHQSSNSDDQFLSIPVKDLIAQAASDKNYTLTFSKLAGYVKSSI